MKYVLYISTNTLRSMCSVPRWLFLHFLNFVLSRYVVQVLSGWFWNVSSHSCYYWCHFCFHIPCALNFFYEIFIFWNILGFFILSFFLYYYYYYYYYYYLPSYNWLSHHAHYDSTNLLEYLTLDILFELKHRVIVLLSITCYLGLQFPSLLHITPVPVAVRSKA